MVVLSVSVRRNCRYEACEQAEGGGAFVAGAVRLGHHLVADDEQHGAGGESQRGRQQNRTEPGQGAADQRAERFDQAGKGGHADCDQG
jgi:hypothetical protein